MSEQQSRLSVVISTEQAKRNAEALNKSLAEMNKKGDDAAKSATNVGKSADGAKSGLKSHKGAVDDVAKSYSNWSSLAKTTIAGVIAGIGKSAIDVAAFATMATLIAKTGKEMQAMAYQSNSTAEELQGFVFAAKKVNDTFNMDKVGDVFKDVNDKIGDYLTEGGGELKQFFEEIAPKVGVTAEQFRNLSGPQALQLYVSTLEKAGLSQTEMVTHMERIANDATGLLPILQDNGKAWKELAASAQDAGLIMSNEAAANAAELDNKISMLSDTIIIMRNYFAEEIIPIINAFIDNMTLSEDGTNDLHKGVKEFAQDGSFKQWFIGVGYAVAGVIDVARLAGQIIDALGKTIAYVMVQGARFDAWTDSLNPFGHKSQETVDSAKANLKMYTNAANEAEKEMSDAMNKEFHFNAIDAWSKSVNDGEQAVKTQLQLAGSIDRTTKSLTQQAWEQKKAREEAEKAARAKEREAKAVKQIEAAFLKPYDGDYRISDKMGWREKHPVSGLRKYHAGVDVAMPIGTSLKAMSSGVVTQAGVRGGYGNTITIKHDDGTKTMYAHLSKALFKAGERVAAGQVVAKSGNTGIGTGAHGHIEAWDKDGNRIDFRNMIGKKTINKVGEASKSKYLELTQQEKDLALEYNIAMQERMIMLGKETELQKLNAEIELGKYESVEPERIKQMQQMAEQYDNAVKLNEQQERANALIEEATGAGAIKSYYEDMNLLSEAFKNGKINAEQYTLALAQLERSKPAQLNDGFEGLRNWITETNEQSFNLGDTLANSFATAGDALAEFVATGKMEFGDLFRSIAADYVRLIANQGMSKLADGLLGMLTSGVAMGSGAGVGTSSVATGIGNGSYGSWAQSLKFADGGHVIGAGTGTSDSILARLSNGEFVVNAKATAQNRQLLEEINSNRFANGGYVGRQAAGGGSKGGMNVVINNHSNAQIETRETTDSNGMPSLEVLVTQIEKQLAGRVGSNQGALSSALTARGLKTVGR